MLKAKSKIFSLYSGPQFVRSFVTVVDINCDRRDREREQESYKCKNDLGRKLKE